MSNLTPAELDSLADRLFARLAERFSHLAAAPPKSTQAALSADEMARDLGISRATLDRWTAAKRIPVMGGVARGRRLYDRTAVRAALTKQEESLVT